LAKREEPASTRGNTLADRGTQNKSSVRNALLVVVAAALIMSPSYFSLLALHRTQLGVSVVAPIALALFLVGAFLLVKVVKD
jgi:hypothetical protein